LTSGYTVASNTAKTTTNTRVPVKYPITLDAAGLQRLMGTLSLIATGLTGTSAMQAAFTWREIR
jgi:hypothetical protein